MTSILTGHKRVVYVQALSRPPVDICLLILHDSELVIFSAVKHPGKSILHFTVIKVLMRYEKRIIKKDYDVYCTYADSPMYFLLFALHSAVWVCELTARRVASVTAPWWRRGQDGAGVGVSGVECAATAVSLAGDQR